MLKELRKYSNLGTPSFFYQLLCSVRDNPHQVWSIDDLKLLFHNRIIDGRSIFDGCFEVAIHIKFLVLDNDLICVNESLLNSVFSEKHIIDRFNELLLLSLRGDKDFFDIFSSPYLSYDIIYKSMQIRNDAFGFKFANFKQLLLDFGIIRDHPTPEIRSYIINGRYKKLFDKTLLPEIKKRRIGVEEFYSQMSQHQIYGEEAEKFVYEFEQNRLNHKHGIDWIAQYVANEGYDIVSYNDETDIEYNRFIEVKSYDGSTPYFYWSKNEFQVAKHRQDNYWVYLVNRTEMSSPGYSPIMIRNPYKEIIEKDGWSKEVDKYRISALI